jgi:hypothetical protein
LFLASDKDETFLDMHAKINMLNTKLYGCSLLKHPVLVAKFAPHPCLMEMHMQASPRLWLPPFMGQPHFWLPLQ